MWRVHWPTQVTVSTCIRLTSHQDVWIVTTMFPHFYGLRGNCKTRAPKHESTERTSKSEGAFPPFDSRSPARNEDSGSCHRSIDFRIRLLGEQNCRASDPLPEHPVKERSTDSISPPPPLDTRFHQTSEKNSAVRGYPRVCSPLRWERLDLLTGDSWNAKCPSWRPCVFRPRTPSRRVGSCQCCPDPNCRTLVQLDWLPPHDKTASPAMVPSSSLVPTIVGCRRIGDACWQGVVRISSSQKGGVRSEAVRCNQEAGEEDFRRGGVTGTGQFWPSPAQIPARTGGIYIFYCSPDVSRSVSSGADVCICPFPYPCAQLPVWPPTWHVWPPSRSVCRDRSLGEKRLSTRVRCSPRLQRGWDSSVNQRTRQRHGLRSSQRLGWPENWSRGRRAVLVARSPAIDTALDSPLHSDGTLRRLQPMKVLRERSYPELVGEGGLTRLVVLTAGVGRRWNKETATLLSALTKAWAESIPFVLQDRDKVAWLDSRQVCGTGETSRPCTRGCGMPGLGRIIV